MSVIFQKHMPEAFFEILLFWPTICRGYFGPILYFHISNRFKAWTLKARFLGENILIGAANLGADRGIGARFAEGAFYQHTILGALWVSSQPNRSRY